MSIESLTDDDIALANIVFASAMMVQKESQDVVLFVVIVLLRDKDGSPALLGRRGRTPVSSFSTLCF